ncbi:probable serine/threonine-protein kinase At1g09600 isoform X2 [Tripterygium wilfordii]|uniref:probable serine/threonine-protein kinase At1g09600 isoform X2 n=1 Tax=Tripterygium wilfordii TaxID=458696 RepID=UPI0018F84EFE|nr:probable serine/threonine-protein kinase At1g09600 isoform X2 [Tripterygium wilfordii]
MGCICSRGTRTNEFVEKHLKCKASNKPSKQLAASFKRDDVDVEVEANGIDNNATARLVSNYGNKPSNTPVNSDEREKKAMTVGDGSTKPQLQSQGTLDVGASVGREKGDLMMIRIGSVTNGTRGAQVVAGWPSWLAVAAGEAINGWAPRRADSFEKLEKIGEGTYSSVYKARDLDTNKIVALKKVRFANKDPESVRFMAREIIILRRLDHPNVIKLEGIITSRVSGSLYLIFEYIEHDLARLAATPGIKFNEAQIKCYMKQLFDGLEHCHSHGILHRDIKASNILIDYDGNLKICDLGLASFFSHHKKQPLTSRVVTLWYRPPELLLGATDYGVSVDLWSAGCILAELFAGKPIMTGRTEVEQLHKIFKLCGSPSEDYWKKSKLPHATIFKPRHPYKRCLAETFKDFPSSTLALLDVLLAVEPEKRGTASSALQAEFFTSSLPEYPPTKEFDVKLGNEDARRQRATTKGHESSRKSSRASKVVPAPDPSAELPASMQTQGQSNLKHASEKYNHEDDGGSDISIEAPKRATQTLYPHSNRGQSIHPVDGAGRVFGSPWNAGRLRSSHRALVHQGAAQLSRFSNSVGVGGSSHLDCSNTGINRNHRWPVNDSMSSEKHDWSNHLLDRSYRKDHEQQHAKESTMGYVAKKTRTNYSGPLIAPGVNLEDMLREHEKQIQRAIRKARTGKTKTK